MSLCDQPIATVWLPYVPWDEPQKNYFEFYICVNKKSQKSINEGGLILYRNIICCYSSGMSAQVIWPTLHGCQIAAAFYAISYSIWPQYIVSHFSDLWLKKMKNYSTFVLKNWISYSLEHSWKRRLSHPWSAIWFCLPNIRCVEYTFSGELSPV